MTFDELCRLGADTHRNAMREIRLAFDTKWGSYFKCGGCGGRLEVLEHAATTLTGTKCIHGDHPCIVIRNGYSLPGRRQK